MNGLVLAGCSGKPLAAKPGLVALKLNKGTQALTDGLDAAGYNEILIASRPSVARRKSPFGFFKR